MNKNYPLGKVISLLVICLFLASVQLSQALTLEPQGKSPTSISRDLKVEAVFENLHSLVSCNDGECIDEEALITIGVPPADALGWLALYHIFMFINSRSQCLESFVPEPCVAMVTHLL